MQINIIVLIVIVLVVILLIKNIYMKEYFTPEISSEAIQNVTNLYNPANISGTFKVSNLQIPETTQLNNLVTTGTSNLKNLKVSGTSQLNNLQVTGDTQLNTLTVNSLNLLPHGTIILWSGSKAPSGWSLCDGTNGTPNLNNLSFVSQTYYTTLSVFKLVHIMKL